MATLAFAVLAQSAFAGRAWCRTDPIVSIDGDLVDIIVSAPLPQALDLTQFTGPTLIVVRVPRGVDARLVLIDIGFGKGAKVTFEESRKLRRTDRGIEVQVKVLVPTKPSTEPLPILVEIVPRLLDLLSPVSKEGVANQPIVLRTII